MAIAQITRAYIRRYSDTGQIKAYVEWLDTRGRTGRTEGAALDRDGWLLPKGAHIEALFSRAMREGLTVGVEIW